MRPESRRPLDIRTLRRLSGLLSGAYRTTFHGNGLEFAELREYAPGDDVRAIDWHASAKTGRTFVRRYTEERNIRTIFLADV